MLEIHENNDNNTEEIKLSKTTDLGVLDLFKHPGCRNASLIMFVNWIAVNLGINKTKRKLSSVFYVRFIRIRQSVNVA